MVNKGFKKSKVITFTPLILVLLALLFAVACGTAAPDTAKTVPDTAAPDTAAPDKSKPAITAPDAISPPTAVPAAADPPEAMAMDVHPGMVVIMVNTYEAERFDTIIASSVKEIRKSFHGHLTSWDDFDGQMRITAGIATKWDIEDGGRTVTYTILEGGKFHDGTEITPEDVVWTLRHAIGPGAEEWAYGSVTRQYSTKMDRIELGPGPNQVSVYSTIPIAELPLYISENAGGASKGQVMPARAAMNDKAELKAYEKNPIGAGPVKLVKHVVAETIFFERHDEFYYTPENGYRTDKRLKFKDMELRLVPDETTRAAALRTGEADMGAVSLATQAQVEKGGGRLVFSPEAVIIESHFWGCYRPEQPCNDKRVRQAFNYALDKDKLRDLLGEEVMEPLGWWIVTPSTVGYSPELKPWPYDPVKARQLFTEAGYKNPDNPNGKDYGVQVINTYPGGLVANLVESARLVADGWEKELGVEMRVNVMDKVSFGLTRNENIEEFDGQLNWLEQNTRLDASGIARLYFLAVHKGLEDIQASRTNNDPEIKAMMEDFMAQVGLEGYAELANKVFLQLQEESYEISAGYVNAPIGVGPRILTWKPYGVSEYISALHTITLPEGER